MSRRTVQYIPFISLIVLFIAGTPSYGQSGGDFSITWSTMGDGSGGSVSGGDFTLEGTIGQADGGSELSEGRTFGHRNGYWVFSARGTSEIVIYCYKDGTDVRIEWGLLPDARLYDVYYGNDKLRKEFYILDHNVEPPYIHTIDPDDHNDYYYDVYPVPWK